jgi:hypothetical protein
MGLAKGWDRESEDLYIHESGARISRSTYRGKLAWWFIPVSLDVPAVEHPPTDEGREEAFATSAKELPKLKTRAKPKVKVAVKKESTVPKDEDGRDGDSGEAEEDEKEEKDEDGE